MTPKTVLSSLSRFFGIMNRNQALAYQELMSLSDRELEDIGLPRGLIATVVLQGPRSVQAVLPDGAVQAAANVNRSGRATVA